MLYAASVLIILSLFCNVFTLGDYDRKLYKLKSFFWKPDPTVKFYYYGRDGGYEPENMEIGDRNGRLYSSFDPTRPLKIIVHGWLGNNDVRFSKRIRDGFLNSLDVDLISVDWSDYGSKLYPLAMLNVPRVASVLADFLDYLSYERGVALERLHVLGHSLGAHIAGIAGMMVSAGKIGRITGFDPAKPLFSEEDTDERLNPSSANFVDVIHTCNNYLGMETAIGHADFYPNGGLCWQPGCGLLIKVVCSHRRSYHLYIESILRNKTFPAIACSSWEDFLNKENCDLENMVYMGEGVSQSARGSYYLETTGDEPFGLGQMEF